MVDRTHLVLVSGKLVLQNFSYLCLLEDLLRRNLEPAYKNGSLALLPRVVKRIQISSELVKIIIISPYVQKRRRKITSCGCQLKITFAWDNIFRREHLSLKVQNVELVFDVSVGGHIIHRKIKHRMH